MPNKTFPTVIFILGLTLTLETPLATEATPREREIQQSLQSHMAEGQIEQLLGLVEKVQNGEDYSPRTQLDVGNALFWLGEYEAALREHKAATGDPRVRVEAQFEAMVDLMAMRRFAEACEELETVRREAKGKNFALDVLQAHLELRCGDPAKGLALIRRFFADGHSSAEEVLAAAFGQGGRYARYRAELEGRRAAFPGDLEVHRALAELLTCPDSANPWFLEIHADEAGRLFDELTRSTGGQCVETGRSAVADLLRVEVKTKGKVQDDDLDVFRAIIGDRLKEDPQCSEIVEARYLYLDIWQPTAVGARVSLLESAVKRFPESQILHDLLLDEYSMQELDGTKPDNLEQMVRSFPDDWFPYARRTLAEVENGMVGQAAFKRVEQGLSRLPHSLPLNYLKTILLLSEKRFKEAVVPAAQLLAGLMETKTYHHNWEIGMSLLHHALKKKEIFSKDPKQAAGEWRVVREMLTLRSAAFSAGHGCFTTGGNTVAILPVWYRPGMILQLLAAPPR